MWLFVGVVSGCGARRTCLDHRNLVGMFIIELASMYGILML